MNQFIRCYKIICNILKDPKGELAWIYSKYCKVSPNKIVLSSYGGNGYSCNPKYITEEILRQNLSWDLVWLMKDTSIPVPKGVRKVKYNSPRALCEMASARVIINNIRGYIRPWKKEGQVYIQTWHGGIGFKNAERAVEDKLGEEYVYRAKTDAANCDAILSNCKLLSEEYKAFFWLSEKTEILEYGLPRNDLLFNREYVKEKYSSVRQQYGFLPEQKIILYMPTFRVDHSMDGYELDFNGIISAMEQRIGKEVAMIIRLHPNVQDHADMIPYSDKIINGTKYPDVQELYMAADYLITDYSSAAFDFALLNRPVFLCMLDYEAYIADRGVNKVFELCPFHHTYSSQELIAVIENFSEEDYRKSMEEFKDHWKPFDDGHAAERVVEWLKEKIKK